MAITKITTPELLDFPNDSTSSANTSGTVIPTGTTGFNVDCLIVAGGGGSGYADSIYVTSGGGGGGGYQEITSKLLQTNTAYTLTVGDGGTGGTSATVNGTNGDNSVFDSIISAGGGGGASGQNVGVGGSAGGSGGGGSGNSGTSVGGLAISPWQGNNGGDGEDSAGSDNSGGGGGANSVGGTATSGSPGNGGAGTTTSLFNGALNIERAGGGGGANGNSTPGGTATGGGGAGGEVGSASGTAGTANTGGGGGGSYGIANGVNGGSGIVIIKYTTTDVTSFSVTGTINTPTPIIDGSYSYLVFTSVGTGTLEFILSGSVRPISNLNEGEFRFNTTTDYVEYYDGSDWQQIADEYISGQPTTCLCNYPTTATALYQFNDNVNDTCGNYNGIASNLNPYVTGKFGKAASFNGTVPSRIDVNGYPIGNWNNGRTFSFWANWTNFTNTSVPYSEMFNDYLVGHPIIYTDNSGFFRIGYSQTNGSNNDFTYWQWVPGADMITFNTGQWYHIVLAGNDTNVKLYVDGIEQGTPAKTTGVGFTTGGVYRNGVFGDQGEGASSYVFTGLLDQVRVFPTALTGSQVTELYNELACN